MPFEVSAPLPSQREENLPLTGNYSSRQQVCRALFLLFLLVIDVYLVKNALWNVRHQDGWSMGDWLINYHGGFIRRGLPGAVILGTCRLLGLNLFWAVAAIQLGFYAALEFTVWCLVRNSQWPAWMLFALLSPATLLFPVREFPEAYRKEEMLLVGLAWLLLSLRKQETSRWLSPLLAVFAGVCILSHEALACYLPYVFVALYAGFHNLRKTLAVAALPLAVTLVCFALTAAHPGNAYQADEVCRGIGFTQLNPLPAACNGAISYLAFDKGYAKQMVSTLARQRHYHRIYPVAALLAAFPLLWGAFSLWRYPADRRPLLGIAVASLVSIVGSIPLFIYAFDWNRWIYIHTFCLMLLLLFLAGRQPSPQSQPRITPLRVAALALVLLLYASTWRDSFRQPLQARRFSKLSQRFTHRL